MSVKQLTLSLLILAISGCVSPLPTTLNSETSVESTVDTTTDKTNYSVTKQHYDCKHIQRNLTVSWEQRSYWCVPNN